MHHARIIEIFKNMVALTACAAIFFSCKDEAPKADANEGKQLPTLEIENLDARISRFGKSKTEVTAPLLRQTEKKHKDKQQNLPDSSFLEFTKGVQVKSFNDNFELESTITAKYAIQKIIGSDTTWAAYDSVVVTNVINKQKLVTDTLYWEQSKHLIFTNSFATVYTPTIKIPAENGLWADQNFTNYELRSPRDGDIKFVRGEKDSTTNSIDFPAQPIPQQQIAPQTQIQQTIPAQQTIQPKPANARTNMQTQQKDKELKL